MKKILLPLLGLLFFICVILFVNQEEKQTNENEEKIGNYELSYSEGAEEDPAAREQYEFNMLRNPLTGKIPESIRTKEIEFSKKNFYKSSALKKTYVGDWTSAGPDNVAGRTRALAVDITNDSIWFVGGVSGGLYRTTNQGYSWDMVTSNEDLPSISSIAQNVKPGHSNIWYYGTGEYGNSAGKFAAALLGGNGIYKSIDNGITWKLLPSTSYGTEAKIDSFDYCNKIITNPYSANDDEVYAAFLGGICRSTDGGKNWERVLGKWDPPNVPIYTDITLAADTTFYAAIGTRFNSDYAGLYSSKDGKNWKNITPVDFPSQYINVTIAASKSNPGRVYFLVNLPQQENQDNELNQVWILDKDSAKWNKLNFSNISTQNGYCMVMAVHPENENILFLGAVNLFRIDLENNSIKQIGGWSSTNPPTNTFPGHWVDQHVLAFLNNSPNSLLSGNDAGVSFTKNCLEDSVLWTYKPKGLITSQFYSVDISPNPGNQNLIGGLQDRGCQLLNNSSKSWKFEGLAADGSYCAFTSNDSIFFTSAQQGQIIRIEKQNGKEIWTRIDPGKSPLFITPFQLDPNDENVMFLANGQILKRNSDLSGIMPNNGNSTSKNWSNIAIFDQIISAIGVSKNPADIVYCGLSNGKVYKVVHEGNETRVSSISDSTWNGYISNICVNPENGDEVIVVFSNYGIPSLYYTDNGGKSWRDISGNLEENRDGSGNGPSCRWANIVTQKGNKLYLIGTSTGLYYTDSLNGISTKWIHEDKVIGNSVVTMIKSRNSDGFIAAATHGRGVFTTSLATGIKENNTTESINFSLSQNYPNPFNPSTKIDFILPRNSNVTLKVYDITGSEVKNLVDGEMEKGEHKVLFNGSSLASGIYFYKLTAFSKDGKYQQTNKMILLK